MSDTERNILKEQILERAETYLEPDRKGKGFICPVCHSGSGKNGTGITTQDHIHFTCWAGCYTHADIIDIIGQKYGITEYAGKLQKAAEEMGLAFAGIEPERRAERRQAAPVQKREWKNGAGEGETDYSSFFLQAHEHISETEYHRGLSRETLDRFQIGYVENWTHPKAPNAPVSPRLIIPTSKYSYLARDTRGEMPENQQQYSKSKVGAVRIFNAGALRSTKKPVFIVEGEIDALSIMDVGGAAVGLGSVSNARNLLAMLDDRKPECPLLLALDQDEAGRKAEKELTEGLIKRGIRFFSVNITDGSKDANEALNKDRAKFREAVLAVENIEAEAMDAAVETLRDESVGNALQDFLDNIEKSKTATCIPTGFSCLDALLDGGLYAGLYIVGAISSLGKTTFCLQIADQIADQGVDVLIFSLEMARDELIAKSVSRITAMEDLRQYGSTVHAKTTRGILTGARWASYNRKEQEIICDSMEVYKGYASNLFITEGVGDVGVEQIRNKVRRHVQITGKKPVVLIDYLQIIAPADPRATDKQNTDKAVLELKRLSRDYGIPVIGISSFNRDNYKAPVNLASFKESGAIEYSSDVLLGLQYAGMDYMEGEDDKKREKRIREMMEQNMKNAKEGKAQKIQVKVLKNRNGSKGDTQMDFYPKFNWFADSAAEEGAGTEDAWEETASTFRA